jgi:HTH-type transcriptional regulator, sugar sensing transcriptional regulator
MEQKILQDIGLTEGEIKVYLALLKLGETKTGELSKQASVSSSKVYKILDRLEKKGIVGHVLRGEIKYFSPMNPKTILNYIEEKEKTLENKKQEINKLIPQFNDLINNSENKSQAAIYEGLSGVTNLFRNMIDELDKGQEYFVIGASYGPIKGIRDFFYKHHLIRVEKKIKLNMLANSETRGNLEQTTAKISEIKFLPGYLSTTMQIVFYKNKAFVIIWNEEPVGFLINNEEAVKGFRAYFNVLWKIAKK